MTNCGFPTTNPECLDSELVILTKILQRLNINAAVQADLPSGNVAVTNFPANQTVTVSNPDGYPEDTPATAGEIVFMAGVVRQDVAGSLVDVTGDRTELQVNSAGSLRVEVTSGGTGGTQYAEDTPSAAGDLLNMAGVVRQDAAGSLVGTDGDRTQLQVNSTGSLRVEITSGGSGGTQYAEDTAAAAGDLLNMAGVVRRDAQSSLVDADGDRTQLQVNATGALRVDGSGVTQPVSDAGGSLTVDNAGVFAVQVTSGGGGTEYAEDTASTAGEMVTMAGVVRRDTIGTLVDTDNDRTELQVNASGSLRVDGSAVTQPVSDAGGSITVDNAGTFAVQVTSGGGGTQYAEDTPSVADEIVTMAGVVRRDTIGTLVSADGDRTELQVTNTGALRTDGSAVAQPVTDNAGSLTVDNAGTFAVQVTSGGVTQYAEDTPHLPGEQVIMAGVVRRDTPGSLVGGDDERTELQVNSAGSLRVEVTAGGTTQYAEDTPSVAGDLLNMAGVVRVDSPATLADADGDRTQLQVNIFGALRVDGSGYSQTVTGTVTVNNLGTFAVQDSQKLADNSAFSHGSTPLEPVGFIFDEAATGVLVENNIAAARIDSKRAIVTTIEDATTRGLRATIRDLASNDALNVAIVDGAGAQVTSFGGGTQYAEDTASVADELVTMAGVVRRDAIGTLVSATNDRTELQVTENGALRVDGGAGSISLNIEQEALSTTQETLVAARATRRSVFVQNLDASITVYIGFDTTVSSTTGIRLKAGEGLSLNTRAAIFAIAASGTPTVSFAETYD